MRSKRTWKLSFKIPQGKLCTTCFMLLILALNDVGHVCKHGLFLENGYFVYNILSELNIESCLLNKSYFIFYKNISAVVFTW